MAAEDETPRGALACLHTTEGGEGGRQLREGRGGTPGLSTRLDGQPKAQGCNGRGGGR